MLPLWWSLGGIAAALLVGFLIFNPFNQQTTTKAIITVVEQNNTDTIVNPNNASKKLNINRHNEKSIQEVVTGY